jgi:hypothetical protein
LKRDTYYLFKPENPRRPWYRTTNRLAATLLQEQGVNTAIANLDLAGGAGIYQYIPEALRLQWVAFLEKSQESLTPLLTPPFNLPPLDPPPTGSGAPSQVYLCNFAYVFRQRAYVSYIPASWDRPTEDEIVNAWTGISYSVNFQSSGFIFSRPNEIPKAPFFSYINILKGQNSWYWILTQAYIFTGYCGFYPVSSYTPRPDPVIPTWWNPPGAGGGGGGGGSDGKLAGLHWESTVFQLPEQLDILLSLAYSVQWDGAGSTYIEIQKPPGSEWVRLEATDFKRGAKFKDRPVTLPADEPMKFVVHIDKASHINRAIARLGGDSWVCNCPDWNRKSKKFASRFPSELGDRDWSSSGAGARGDCKHIIRCKIEEGEPLLRDRPDDLDTIQQNRKEQRQEDAQERKRQRQELREWRKRVRKQEREDRKAQRKQEREYQKRVKDKYKPPRRRRRRKSV